MPNGNLPNNVDCTTQYDYSVNWQPVSLFESLHSNIDRRYSTSTSRRKYYVSSGKQQTTVGLRSWTTVPIMRSIYYNEFKFTEDIFIEDKNVIIRTLSLTVGNEIYFPLVVL